MRPKPATPQKILIVKLSAIGDVIQTLPMFTALRWRFPEAKIDWLVEEEAADLLHGYPGLDRVFVSRRRSWPRKIRERGNFWSTVGEIRSLLRELRKEKYDWIIDNHGGLKSGIWTAVSRGKRKIGYQATAGIADEGNYLFTNERYRPLSIERHALERYLHLIAQLGVPVDRVPLEYPVSPKDRETVQRRLQESGFHRHPLVILHPLAKWETKQWPLEKFAKLADALVDRGAWVVMTGSPQDASRVRRILAQTRSSSRILNLTGKIGLPELAALFSLSDLIIAPDTGPMHLAAAVRAPLVALFGPTAPWRTGPYGKEHRILRKELPCSPCFRKSCSTLECMQQLSVEEVLKAAEEKISTRGEKDDSK